MKAQQSFVEEAFTDDGSVGRALDAAAALVGGRIKLADALGVQRSAIGNWKTRGVPIEYCPRIESLANKRITRRDLRPNDYHLIWPELADRSALGGAVPAQAANGELTLVDRRVEDRPYAGPDRRTPAQP